MELIKTAWSNEIYPCSEYNCGFVGPLNAWTFGEYQKPCPKCGGKREQKTGRAVYRKVSRKWFPFIFRQEFVKMEWKDNSQLQDKLDSK